MIKPNFFSDRLYTLAGENKEKAELKPVRNAKRHNTKVICLCADVILITQAYIQARMTYRVANAGSPVDPGFIGAGAAGPVAGFKGYASFAAYIKVRGKKCLNAQIYRDIVIRLWVNVQGACHIISRVQVNVACTQRKRHFGVKGICNLRPYIG